MHLFTRCPLLVIFLYFIYTVDCRTIHEIHMRGLAPSEHVTRQDGETGSSSEADGVKEIAAKPAAEEETPISGEQVTDEAFKRMIPSLPGISRSFVKRLTSAMLASKSALSDDTGVTKKDDQQHDRHRRSLMDRIDAWMLRTSPIFIDHIRDTAPGRHFLDTCPPGMRELCTRLIQMMPK